MLLSFLLVLALAYGLRGSEGAQGEQLPANHDQSNPLGFVKNSMFESAFSGNSRSLLLAQDASSQSKLQPQGGEQRQKQLELNRVQTELSRKAMLGFRETKRQEEPRKQEKVKQERLEKERPELKQQRLEKVKEISRLRAEASKKAYQEYQERQRQQELYKQQDRQKQRGRSMVTCVRRQEKACTTGMCKHGETCKPMNTCRGYICLADRSNLQTKTPRKKVDKISKSPEQGSLAPEGEKRTIGKPVEDSDKGKRSNGKVLWQSIP